jgi:phosphoketolase
MVPAYVGYLTVNALTGLTRSWLMGQGHCVAAIDAVNVLVDNMSDAHAARYSWDDDGLSRLVRDFYSYAVDAQGRPASPLGSHVNAHTAGGLLEGGYLGFAELQYVHMPLPGERLVAFLSDGAFEEQRGSDWAPRWWRAEDCGHVAPIMIANGRRIEQRTAMAGDDGLAWFREHLVLNGFDPLDFDGRDPAAFAWAIFEIEERLSACIDARSRGALEYPVRLHYGIAHAPKGYGFPGAGTNAAHNLPLPGVPRDDDVALRLFNEAAARLHVPPAELSAAVEALSTHAAQSRPRERDHALARRQVRRPALPEVVAPTMAAASPMAALDAAFVAIADANPSLRIRVGNPDEFKSNRMGATLARLRHRALAPEANAPEAIDGAVITALNEEAVVCAALANKGGLNLVVSYEAFAVKMLGALRQELIFARHLREAGRAPGWLSVPIVLTSHTWENGKNELSHQDPTLAEALLAEMSDSSRVLFPADWHSALASLYACYRSHGEIWTLVVPKREVVRRFDAAQAAQLVRDGALRLRGRGAPDERLVLTAIGAYQLEAVLCASDALSEARVPHAVVYLLEPGRFRAARDGMEAAALAPDVRAALYPGTADARVFVTHTRPEPMLGLLRPLDTGPPLTRALGFRNRGGTLDVRGMLLANGCTARHVLGAALEVLDLDPAPFAAALAAPAAAVQPS